MNRSVIQQNPLLRVVLIITLIMYLVLFLYVGRPFLVTFSFAALFSMLMQPLANWLEERGMKRGFASGISTFVLLITILGVLFLFSSLVINFGQDLGSLQSAFQDKLDQVQRFIEKETHISNEKQVDYLRTQAGTFFSAAGIYIRNFLVIISTTLANIGLIVVYIFFLLLYRGKIRQFLLSLTRQGNRVEATEIINSVSFITQKYLAGRLIVMVIVAVMYSVGLMIVGLRHAIFFGVLAAFLNIIPYVGTFIGGLLPVLMALLTEKTFSPVIGVVIVLIIIQVVENNVLVPLIIGSRVNINPLSTIVVIILGNMLWGLSGMILFVPLLGVAKIVFDKIKPLKPFGYLIGSEEHMA